MTFEDVLHFLSIFTSGVTEGILLVVMVAVMPAMLGLPDAMALRFKQPFDPLVDRIQPPFVMTALFSGVLLLIFADDPSTTATIFTILGIVGAIGVAAMSLGFNMRINRTMGGWNAEAPPAEFRPLIGRWMAGHRLRTLFGTVAFVAYTVSALA